MGFSSTTPRPSNLTNAEIYSLQSSRKPTPRGSSFNHTDFYSMVGRSSNFGAADAFGIRTGATPRPSNYADDAPKAKHQYQIPAANAWSRVVTLVAATAEEESSAPSAAADLTTGASVAADLAAKPSTPTDLEGAWRRSGARLERDG